MVTETGVLCGVTSHSLGGVAHGTRSWTHSVLNYILSLRAALYGVTLIDGILLLEKKATKRI